MFANKKEKLVELELHRGKLARLIGEMLGKAEDLDQSTKYGHQIAADSQALLTKTWRELVELSAAVDDIAKLIKARDVAASQKALLRAADIANHLSERLSEIKRTTRPS